MTYEECAIKFEKYEKLLYYFMFFVTVCSSFTGSKCMLQKLEDPIK